MPSTGKGTAGQRKPTLQKTRSNDDSNYPGLKQLNSPEPGKTQYTQVQEDEILVLQAIYGEDFIEHKAANTAWQRSEPAFDVRIKALSDEELTVTLGVVLTATYPKSMPLLSLKDDSSLGQSTLFKIQTFIESKPRELAASGQNEPMIHDIASGIQDILELAAEAKAQGRELPSLEEERAVHEAELARKAEQEQSEQTRKLQEADAEEARMMANMIQEEMKRQRAKERESKKRGKPPSLYPEDSYDFDPGNVNFDEPCKVTDLAGNDAYFTTVTGRSEYRQGMIASTFAVRAVIMDRRNVPPLALKEVELKQNSREASQFKKHLLSLENKLKSVKQLNHRNILNVIDFRIDRKTQENEASQTRIVRILTPLANKGSLDELLELTEKVAIGKVRSWTTDLLSGLGWLHTQGLVHEDIHPGNVLLFRESSGHVVPKLADASYQRELHAICRKSRAVSLLTSARSTYWLPPELDSASALNQKTDIWDFGVVFLQMVFGLDVFEKYEKPSSLMSRLSPSLHELVSKFFKQDPGRRPRASDLRSSEFLATDAPVYAEDFHASLSPSHSSTSLPKIEGFRRRLDSTALAPSFSRFKNEFTEEGRLGKGGFGEVIKVRKKIDGQTYAIKKVVTKAAKSLTSLLKEVSTLSALSHPSIVRYYDAWTEQLPDSPDTDGDASADETSTQRSMMTGSNEIDIQFATSTGGLDFMSSANVGDDYYHDDDDDDDDEDSDEYDGLEVVVEDDEDEADGDDGIMFQASTAEDNSSSRNRLPVTPKRIRSHTQSGWKVLYILMEYCEKKTLRDLISQNLFENQEEVWRLFREVLDGLNYMHTFHNIVHRDLKPENIFISSGTDGVAHVKIGDFGLATGGQVVAENRAAGLGDSNGMSNVGTALYSAPELERSSGTDEAPPKIDDSRKLDMYALGIIFFEMLYKPMGGHERITVLNNLRGKHPTLPSDFKPYDKVQTEIILSLVTHNANQRPGSSELLRSGKVPMPMESETLQRALAEISDPLSTHHQKLVTAMFGKPTDKTKDYTWDMSIPNVSSTELLYQGIVKDQLKSIFRRHGAVEASTNPLYPRSSHYTQNVVELLDRGGTVLQLPYDLMLGNARALAKHTGTTFVPKSFTFENIYRDRHNGGQPSRFGEVAFDIVSTDTLDLALKEAELLKVLDEIVDSFPSLNQMCFHLGHSDLLQLIFDFCDVDHSARSTAAEVLSKLNIHSWTWQKIRAELRVSGLSVTSIDELQRFDFRDTPTKAFSKLKAIFEGSKMLERVQPIITHLREVVGFAKRFGLHSKVYVNPLSSFRERFFVGGMLFQCVYDKKYKDVFAVGGRYDSLINEHRPRMGNQSHQRHAVGFSLAWEKLAMIPKAAGKAFLKKADAEPQGMFNTKRCDVLVASFDTSILRSDGIELLQTLWAHDISAELARDARSPEDLLTKHRDESYSWIIMVKQEAVLKIKTMGRKDVPDAEVPTTQVISWLRAELRERDRYLAHRAVDPAGGSSGAEKSGNLTNTEQKVSVFTAGTKSKKFNRRTVVEQAQANAAALVQNFLDGPVAAVETSDAVLELIQATALSDAESWRSLEQSVNMAERKYMREIHDELLTWRNAWETKNGSRHAFVYNFRTTKCIYYDLGV